MICPFPLNLPGKGNVPCGKCYACLSNKRNEWDFRLLQEAANAASSFFITLTYDNEHLPVDGEVNPDHLRNFFKRLRNRFLLFRYYAVAEYGERKGRPHYHFLCFTFRPVSSFIMQLHVSSCWHFGRIHVGELTTTSVHYVTKWHIHPKTEKHGFTRQSKGLGSSYLENLNLVSDFPVNVFFDHRVYPLARYYRRKMNLPAGEFARTPPIYDYLCKKYPDKSPRQIINMIKNYRDYIAKKSDFYNHSRGDI